MGDVETPLVKLQDLPSIFHFKIVLPAHFCNIRRYRSIAVNQRCKGFLISAVGSLLHRDC